MTLSDLVTVLPPGPGADRAEPVTHAVEPTTLDRLRALLSSPPPRANSGDVLESTRQARQWVADVTYLAVRRPHLRAALFPHILELPDGSGPAAVANAATAVRVHYSQFGHVAHFDFAVGSGLDAIVERLLAGLEARLADYEQPALAIEPPPT